MNEKIKETLMGRHSYILYFFVTAIICFCIYYVTTIINGSGRIDDSGIQRVDEQLNDVRTEQYKAIESNQQIGTSIEHSIDFNTDSIRAIGRSEDRITNSQRQLETATAGIDTVKNVIADAKRTATESANLISESQSILRGARERAEKSKSTNPE